MTIYLLKASSDGTFWTFKKRFLDSPLRELPFEKFISNLSIGVSEITDENWMSLLKELTEKV